jgi:hypothetical protein
MAAKSSRDSFKMFMRLRRGSALLTNLTVSAVAGIIVLRFERELRSLSQAATWAIVAVLLSIAALPAFAPQFQAIVHRLSGIRKELVYIAGDYVLSVAPLLFIIATLLVVYATSIGKHDLIAFLRPLGPIVAGCGGAMSLAMATATGRVASRARVWRYVLRNAMFSIALVVASALFNRFGFHLFAWSLGAMAVGAGEGDIHAAFNFVIEWLSESLATPSEKRLGRKR